MNKDEFVWIAGLPNPEAFDLSALGEDGSSTPKLPWIEVLDALDSSSGPHASKLLPRLKWLGLCLYALPSNYAQEEDVFPTILAACVKLETLSVRAPQGYEAPWWSAMPFTDPQNGA